MNLKLNFVDSKLHVFLLNLVGVLSLIILLHLVIFLFYNNEIKYFLSTIIAVLFITKIGQAIGQHRYFSHKSFQVNKFFHYLLAMFATLSCTGTVIHYAAIHRTHHRFSDTDQDPHSPYHNGFIKTWFANLDDDVSKKIPKKIVIDLMRDSGLKFFHYYYWVIIFLYILILLIIDIKLILFSFLIPIGYSRLCTGLQSTLSHNFGYKNFETTDNSTNNFLINIITLGEGSHNNHHYKQNEYNFGYTGKLKEFDLSAFIIKYFVRGKKI